MAKVSDEQVRQALLEYVSRHISVGFTAEVTANDQAAEEGLIEVTYRGMTFEPKLRAVSGDTSQGELRIPAKGSMVFCVSEGNSENMLVVTGTTALDSYTAGFGDTTIFIDEEGIVMAGGEGGEKTLEIKKDAIVFNGGEDGLVKIRKLEENLKTIKDFVDAMHKAIPAAIGSIGEVVGGSAGSGAASGNAGKGAYDGAMSGQSISFEDMEDKNVLH